MQIIQTARAFSLDNGIYKKMQYPVTIECVKMVQDVKRAEQYVVRQRKACEALRTDRNEYAEYICN